MEIQTVKTERPWWYRIIFGRNPWLTLIRACVWVGLAIVIFKYMLTPVRVQGISMQPTYRHGGINFVNHWSYRRHPPARGDVVGIRYVGNKVMLLKRIIGLPGERIRIQSGFVYINGELLQEPYVKLFNADWEREEETLESDSYFVIGDNREMSIEQHALGRVEGSRIVGKALF